MTTSAAPAISAAVGSKAEPDTTTPSARPGLLKLPLEIREQIYAHIFQDTSMASGWSCGPYSDIITKGTRKAQPQCRPYEGESIYDLLGSVGLVKTSCDHRRDAQLYFYRTYALDICLLNDKLLNDMVKWLSSLPAEHVAAFRRLRINVWARFGCGVLDIDLLRGRFVQPEGHSISETDQEYTEEHIKQVLPKLHQLGKRVRIESRGEWKLDTIIALMRLFTEMSLASETGIAVRELYASGAP